MNPGLAWVREEPMRRLELLAGGLQNRCSTTELHRLVIYRFFAKQPRLENIVT
jgi:hypothetical protein